MDFDAGIREAEIYRSMGLLKESLAVYDEILATTPKNNPQHTEVINKEIRVLKREIEDLETHAPQISQEDISVIKEALAVDGQRGILDNAVAFKQLGLVNEAVSEYEKLFKTDYPVIKIIPDFGECLLKLHGPEEAVKRFGQVVGKLKL
ncbi:MAG TPA: type II/IV secretion system protein, partial [Desulfobacteria bacterium]|nr:type II/IV secretion system protein [Desulfobacteria bacterium]